MSRSFRHALRAAPHGMVRPLLLLAAVIWGAIAAVLGMVALLLFSAEALPLRDIEVYGDLRQLHVDAVRAMARPHTDRGFIMSDIVALREELLRDPWIHDAVVRRKWPDTINISVVEERAFARWGDEGFLSNSGDFFVLADVNVLRHGLPLLSGPEESHDKVFARYGEISGMLRPSGLLVTELHLSRRDSWSMKLDNGWQVQLGRLYVDRNLQRLLAVVRGVLAGRAAEVDVVDMRYENGYAVAWKKQAVDDGFGSSDTGKIGGVVQ